MRWLIIFQFALGFPQQSHAATSLSPAFVRQVVVNEALDEFVPFINNAKSSSDLEKLFPSYMSKRDRETARKTLAKYPKLPKVKRLNRGIAFVIDKKPLTITVEDIYTGRVRFNDSADFTYQPGNPLEIQAERLSKSLKWDQASAWNLFLPRAEALGPIPGMILGAVIGITLGGIFNKPLGDLFGVKLWDKLRGYHCEGKKPSDSFDTATFCKDYFAWEEANRVANKVPEKATETPVAAAEETLKNVKKQCGTASDPDYVNEASSEDGSTYRATRVKFDKKTPTQIVFHSSVRQDRNGTRLTKEIIIDLKPDRTIKRVTDGKGNLLATTDETAIKTMSANQLEANAESLKAVAEYLKPAIAFVETCNSESEQKVAKAADIKGSVAVEEIPSPAVIPPTMLPVSKDEPAAKTTK